MNDKTLIDKFNASKAAKNMVIAYGGDGQLLKVVSQVGNKKGIIPIRNYGRCAKHAKLLEEVVEGTNDRLNLKYSKQPFIDYSLDGEKSIFKNQLVGPIAEIVWKSANPTEAMRFSVLVNGKEYMKQCIADGVICATSLGSHGYFKSVTRTIFNDTESLGLGFIAPTYGLCNLVLKSTDKIDIILERDASTMLSADKCFKAIDCTKGACLSLSLSIEGVSLYGYDVFCCPECRRLRNSTIVNDQYLG
jgi:NAD kinase